jgi:hypothetical protein
MLETYTEAVKTTWMLNKLEGRHNGTAFELLQSDQSSVSDAFQSSDFPVFVMNLKKRPDKRR